MLVAGGAGRCGCGRATKGSRLHLQDHVNDYSDVFDPLLFGQSPSLREFAAGGPVWVSPLRSLEYQEYSDESFLRAVGLGRFWPKLAKFWPTKGPCWDALATVVGRDDRHGVILVEAKSHLREMQSTCKAKDPRSLSLIENAFREVRQALGVPPSGDWLSPYYQYANRLAHLYFLRVKKGIPAWLVFVYFLGDREQKGPALRGEWRVEIAKTKQHLGLPEANSLLDQWVVNLFPELPILVGTHQAGSAQPRLPTE